MAVIEDRCPQLQVMVVDLSESPIDIWNDPDLSRLQAYEPGLDTELVLTEWQHDRDLKLAGFQSDAEAELGL